MGCAANCVKWLLFIFNLIFVLLGIVIVSLGIWMKSSVTIHEEMNDALSKGIITFIVIGMVIFLVSFLGCCGAVSESYCMLLTFAFGLLAIFVVQMSLAIMAFTISQIDDTDTLPTELPVGYKDQIFKYYWTKGEERSKVDFFQSKLTCCGVDSYQDFHGLAGAKNNTIPWSCCGNEVDEVCTSADTIYENGCVRKLYLILMRPIIMGGVLMGVGVTELIGVILASCLAKSIKKGNQFVYKAQL